MKKLFAFLIFLLPAFSFAQVQLDSSNLPIVVINTNGEFIQDEPKIIADMGIIYNGPGQMNHITDPFNDYEGIIGIELRGSTSQFIYPKKQYAVETRDEFGENNNVSLLGLPKENDWILHAPYSDKTLIRNALAYKLAGRIMDYAPRYKFCELIINEEYLGVYLLLEKVKRDKDRVAVSKLEADENTGDDLTGGYILKLDKYDGAGNDGFVSNYGPRPGFPQQTVYQFHYPKPDDITIAQRAYIEDFIDQFESVMDGDDFADPAGGYSKYIDLSTFIDYMLINEVCKNVDAYRISTYLYKDRDSIDGRLKIGPVWDFNLGFGNVDFCMGPEIDAWVLDYIDFCPEDNWLPPIWWKKLRADTTFRNDAKARWVELRSDILSNDNIWTCIDSLVAEIDIAKDRNFERWPVQADYVWPNAFVGGSYSADLDYLKNWLRDRLIWMDGEIDDFDRIIYKPADYFDPLVYPNPFDTEVNFEYYVRDYEEVTILIYNAQGQLVANLQDVEHPNGKGKLAWNDQRPATGVYYYTIYFNGDKIKSGSILCNK
ncbi:MAG: hypothetical protein ACI8P3_001189 [Saprospiraceae bacterium]|jgi:hypothetical protein